ncbi:bacillithiol system redox-active protein YtxJ [Metabacillus herbersteinensis]|uniref:Bacillithiol system redox-active protein YtxJ n=1 Tax=Metabacillus herbersteinensis TaxID=283816 RepID=A0ABV6G9U8_9BACI
MSKEVIETVEQFEDILTRHEKFLFLKNSLTCPISHAAFEEFEHFTEDYQDIPSYYLNVQDARQLSNYISETIGIKHESPQVFLFKSKEVVWSASHWKITFDALSKEMKKTNEI